MLLGLRLVLRREWAAILAGVLVMSALGSLASPAPAINLPFQMAGEAAAFILLARVGVVATIAAFFVVNTLPMLPVAWPPTPWYSGIGFMGIALAAALAIAAFRFATGGRAERASAAPHA
jgi:hypothetical protein